MRTFDGTTAVSYVSTHLWSSSNMMSNCLRLVLPNCGKQEELERVGLGITEGACAH